MGVRKYEPPHVVCGEYESEPGPIRQSGLQGEGAFGMELGDGTERTCTKAGRGSERTFYAGTEGQEANVLRGKSDLIRLIRK